SSSSASASARTTSSRTTPRRSCRRSSTSRWRPELGPAALAVVAATRLETEPLVGALTDAGRPPWATRWPWAVSGGLDGVPVVLAATGLGKANAAAAVAALVAGSGGAVRAVVQVGVGGAYPGAVVPVGAAALADSELDLDLGLGRHP